MCVSTQALREREGQLADVSGGGGGGAGFGADSAAGARAKELEAQVRFDPRRCRHWLSDSIRNAQLCTMFHLRVRVQLIGHARNNM